MKKSIFIAIFSLISAAAAFAQVPLLNVIEHYTNTKCSVCASRNPAFLTNYNTQNNCWYLSVYPSSPYAACPLSQQNVVANDARTNYYGIYGGTPRLVIDGNVIPASANYASAAIFTPYLNQTSPFSMTLKQQKFGTDSIRTRLVIKIVAAHTNIDASLFLGLAEDTIAVNGGNGELKHFNVLRKSIYAPQGRTVVLPTTIGDSVVLTETTPKNAIWNFNRIFSVAILQNITTKQVLQSAKLLPNAQTIFTSSDNFENNLAISVSPNPFSDNIRIETEENSGILQIISLDGRVVFTKKLIDTKTIDTKSLTTGVYILTIKNERGSFSKKIIKL